MNDGFSPSDQFDRLIKYWWIIFLCMLLGAGVGWLVYQSKPPIYEAKSIISTSINYAETGFMTDTEEDHALSSVGDVILSDYVVNSVKSSLDEETQASIGGNLRDYLFAEREGYRWALRVQAVSPEVAAILSAAWAEVALDALEESSNHARQALLLSRQISDLQTCLEQSITKLPSTFPCDLTKLSEIQNQLGSLSEQYQLEQSRSTGIIPALTFTLTQSGTSTGKPMTSQTAGFILAGAILGFIVGMILIITGIPQKLYKALLRGK